jgi:hypothetical protein
MELYIHLFKREIIQHAFEQIYPTNLGEDTYSIIHSYILAQSICHVNISGYYYDHRNAQSIMNTRKYEIKDWLPHQHNIEKIANTLYELPHGKKRFHKSVNSMKYWRKSGYKSGFTSEWEYYHTFSESYRDINIISHTQWGMRGIVFLLYNIYPLYLLGKKIGLM